MSIDLLPHQVSAVNAFRTSGGRLLLWADTGTGKTFCALDCIQRLLAISPDKPILVLCPASVVKQWHDEAARYLGNDELAQITITNYEKLSRADTATPLLAIDWQLVVADECQRLCSTTAKSVKAFRKLKTHYKLAMSATPAPNALHELWSIADWLQAGVWGKSFWSFTQNECITDYFGTITGYRNEAALRQAIAPLIHRIEKDVLTDLPELETETVYLEATQALADAYKLMQSEYRAELAGQRITITNAVGLIGRQRQMVDYPGLFGVADVTKGNALAGLLADGTPTLVFVEHQETARHLSEWFTCPVITGSTPMGRRHKIVQDFQAGTSSRFLVGTYAAAVGLNLQAARRVISYSLYWNPARVDQAVGRAYRMGQTSTVQHITLIVKDTVDEKLEKIIKKKRIMEGKFTRDEIMSLL